MPTGTGKYSILETIFLVAVVVAIPLVVVRQLVQDKNGVSLSEETKQEIARATAEQFAKQKDGFVSEVADSVTKRLAEELGKPKPNEAPDYQSLGELHKLVVASEFPSWTPATKLEDSKIRRSLIVQDGELSKAYIYIKANKGGHPLTSYESIYLKINNKGGHLFRPLSLPIPQEAQESGKTTLLYSLQDLSVLPSVPYSELRTPTHEDLLPLFTNGSRLDVFTFISSLEPAMLDEVSVYYGCKENKLCKLIVQ